MKKLLLMFLVVMLGISGCVHTRSGSINEVIDKPYYASVSIVNKVNRTFGAGTIIYNGVGRYMTVLTAAHVIKGMQNKGIKKFYVFAPYDGFHRRVLVHKIDVGRDLALLIGTTKETKDGPYIKIARYSPSIGDTVYAVGSPLGDNGTVTKGIVSNFQDKAAQRAKRYRARKKAEKFRKFFKKFFKRKLKVPKPYKKDPVRLYRFTAPVFYGNSGGGLFNVKSELIGVVIRIQIFNRVPVPGAGFVASLETIREFL